MADTVIVLLSGGVDSIATATHASNQGRLVALLFVDYGQPAMAEERKAASLAALRLGVKLQEVTTEIPLGTMSDDAGNAGARVVPGRNAVLISLAVSTAVAQGIDAVWMGATIGDRINYPDCMAEWFRVMSEAMRMAYGVDVRAPLVYQSKRRAITLLGADYPIEQTCSCYTPVDGKVCGTCNGCFELEAALGDGDPII